MGSRKKQEEPPTEPPTGPQRLTLRYVEDGDWEFVRKGDFHTQELVFGELMREAKQIFGQDSGVVIVATWTKRQFTNHKSLLIPAAGILGMVARNTTERKCTKPVFWAQLPDKHTPKPGDISVEDLFG